MNRRISGAAPPLRAGTKIRPCRSRRTKYNTKTQLIQRIGAERTRVARSGRSRRYEPSEKDRHCTVGSKPTLRAEPKRIRHCAIGAERTGIARSGRSRRCEPIQDRFAIRPTVRCSRRLQGTGEDRCLGWSQPRRSQPVSMGCRSRTKPHASSSTRNERANGAGGLRVGNERWQ